MTAAKITPAMESQLLLQRGDRLKCLRKGQCLGTIEMVARVGIARHTLRAIESGNPARVMESYLQVMSVLGGHIIRASAEVTDL